MSKREFIRENREEIDRIIRAGKYTGSINDEDRWNWVMNHEGLYSAAKRAGVRV